VRIIEMDDTIARMGDKKESPETEILFIISIYATILLFL